MRLSPVGRSVPKPDVSAGNLIDESDRFEREAGRRWAADLDLVGAGMQDPGGEVETDLAEIAGGHGEVVTVDDERRGRGGARDDDEGHVLGDEQRHEQARAVAPPDE